jgi:NAD(P)-dependent dehydrogenase (short-subunit alcohol dehydrogenase family)
VTFCTPTSHSDTARAPAARTRAPQAVEKALAACDGRLFAVIANAGVGLAGYCGFVTDDVFDRVMSVNFTAAMRLTQVSLVAVQRRPCDV